MQWTQRLSVMINFITVCTDHYPMVYAQKIHKQFQRLTKLSIHHYCITDRPNELPEFIIPIEPYKKSNGWWNKLNLFSPDILNRWSIDPLPCTLCYLKFSLFPSFP